MNPKFNWFCLFVCGKLHYILICQITLIIKLIPDK